MRDNRDFKRVLNMVRGVKNLGLEACCTLGMLSQEQANRLACTVALENLALFEEKNRLLPPHVIRDNEVHRVFDAIGEVLEDL